MNKLILKIVFFVVAERINESCSFDDQCKYKLSTEAECLNGICQCRPQSHYVQQANECYRSASKLNRIRYIIIGIISIFIFIFCIRSGRILSSNK